MIRFVEFLLEIRGSKMNSFVNLFETSDIYPNRSLTKLKLKRISMKMEIQLRNNHSVISTNNSEELAKLYKQFEVHMEGFYLRHPEKYLSRMDLLTPREVYLLEGVFECLPVYYSVNTDKMEVGWKLKFNSWDIKELFLGLNEEFIEINFPTYSLRSHFFTERQKMLGMQQNFTSIVQDVLMETQFTEKFQYIVREVYGEYEKSILVDSSGKKSLY